MKKRIAIFASGSGSNAQKIMEHFKRNTETEVELELGATSNTNNSSETADGMASLSLN